MVGIRYCPYCGSRLQWITGLGVWSCPDCGAVYDEYYFRKNEYGDREVDLEEWYA